MEFKDYQKYKWFLTSKGNLVVGGKSSTQNDELIRSLKEKFRELTILHTSAPGSPFSAILTQTPTESELLETAIFTASFSRAWKENKKKVSVDIFKLSQMHKKRDMKTGTWGVKGDIKMTVVDLELVLTIQNEKLRAVPESSVKKKDILLKIAPGKIDKTQMLTKIQIALDKDYSEEEILSALPAGGVRIVK